MVTSVFWEKMMMKIVSTYLIAAAVFSAGAYAQPSSQDHVKLTLPNEVKWGPLDVLPGTEIAVLQGPISEPGPYTLRLKFPSNTKIPPHYHSLAEHVTVMSGTFLLGHGEKYDAKAMTTLAPGALAIVKAKSPHFATTEGETIVQIHGTGPFDLFFVDPKDDPTRK